MSCGESALVVATFNVRYDNPADGPHRWSERAEVVAERLRDLSADVLAIQEALPHQVDRLERELPGYHREGLGRDGGDDGEQTPLFVRSDRFERRDGGTFWLSPTPHRPRRADEPRPWNTRLNRIATWLLLADRKSGGRPLLVVSTHLDHESELARAESARQILAFVRRFDGVPAIVAGDFNSLAGQTPHRLLSGEGDASATLVDARARAASVELGRWATSLTTWTGPGLPGAHIDHVFVSPSWEVRDYRIDGRTSRYGGADRYPSDHMPVIAVMCQ
jgi:endonuclease/exonuclease/phosphatase family metal-dependent hydrolase